MNCGNEMKMKKWSSQWTQFMQLRKEAWKDTAAVTELWRLENWVVFLHFSSSFLCAGTLSPRGKCCYLFFAGGLVGVNKHLFQMVSLVTYMTPPLNYIFVILRQCRCFSQTKKTKYCLKHEGKSHPCHPWQN